jgi:hypothetical protein
MYASWAMQSTWGPVWQWEWPKPTSALGDCSACVLRIGSGGHGKKEVGVTAEVQGDGDQGTTMQG